MFPFNSFLQDLSVVAKLFAPSVRYPNCGHANDSDFRYCQRCGYTRKILNNGKRTALAIDMDIIDDQLRQLALLDQAASYSKQKDSLQRELENFLSSLPGCLTIATVISVTVISAVFWYRSIGIEGIKSIIMHVHI